MNFSCLNCGDGTARMLYENCVDYYLGVAFQPDYASCKKCGLMQQTPLPADISAFYKSYPVHAKKSWLYRTMRRLVMGGVYFSPPRTGGKLLDYGCGDGSYLRDFVPANYQRFGFEPDAGVAQEITQRIGVPVYSNEEELVSQSGQMDFVTMHFVVEHLTDPKKALQNAYRLLKPGGQLFLTLPNANSIEARIFGRKWHNLDPPRHISFPEPQIVKAWGAAAGFQFVRKRFVPFPNGIAASLAVLLTGRFALSAYLFFLPLGVIFSRLIPSGNSGYTFVKVDQK